MQVRGGWGVAGVLAVALLLAGCGGGEGGESASSTSTVKPTVVKPSESSSGSASSGSESGSGTSSGSGSSSSSSSGAGEITEASKEMPSAAKQHSKAGAKAFGRQYVINLGESIHSLDVGYIEPFHSDGCSNCAKFVKSVQDSKAAGKRLSINPYLDAGDEEITDYTDDLGNYSAVLDVHPHEVVSETGETVGSLSGARVRVNVLARWTAAGWSAAEVELDEQAK